MITKKTLTVFTPTFNRAYILPQLYKSLIRQSCVDFIWLIIDDGSQDKTNDLIKIWINENIIDITYIYQENQGMHGAHNTAYQNINTELNVCIDSDDFLPDNAVELIVEFWENHKSDEYAGLVGLDVDLDGKVIGTNFHKEDKKTTLSGFYNRGGKGDKKLVLRTEIVRKYPAYPLFKEERFVPLGILYLMIDQDYELLVLNTPLCIVEYRIDGSSLNIFKQYIRNPRGFRYSRDIELAYPIPFVEKIKKILHRTSSTFFIGDNAFLKDNPEKMLTILLFPISIVFHQYIKFKAIK